MANDKDEHGMRSTLSRSGGLCPRVEELAYPNPSLELQVRVQNQLRLTARWCFVKRQSVVNWLVVVLGALAAAAAAAAAAVRAVALPSSVSLWERLTRRHLTGKSGGRKSMGAAWWW